MLDTNVTDTSGVLYCSQPECGYSAIAYYLPNVSHAGCHYYCAACESLRVRLELRSMKRVTDTPVQLTLPFPPNLPTETWWERDKRVGLDNLRDLCIEMGWGKPGEDIFEIVCREVRAMRDSVSVTLQETPEVCWKLLYEAQYSERSALKVRLVQAHREIKELTAKLNALGVLKSTAPFAPNSVRYPHRY